jgi:hypothetical protein
MGSGGLGYNIGMKESWQVSAVTFTPRVQQWLQQPTAVSLLHIFDQALNLVDDHGTIISVVPGSIGAGPFSLVVAGERPFSAIISPQDPVHKTATHLHLGPLAIDLRPAKVWQPKPPWPLLHEQQSDWLTLLPALQTAVNQQQDRLTAGSPAQFATQFYAASHAAQQAIAQTEAAELAAAVFNLAGLGPGLTPAGDDFLVGLLLGLRATRPEGVVAEWAKIVVETAVPRTTKLSAAWLVAAAQGEAWLAWHRLLAGLLAGYGWQQPFNQILGNGATSGIAALMGFLAATTCQQT